MNNFDYLLSLSHAELTKFLTDSFCPYPTRDERQNIDCASCILQWLNEKHNGSGLTEYEKIHSMSLKKFAKDYPQMVCSLISPSDIACINNPLCQLQPFKCAYAWLNQNYKERKD